jgi:hypothetical protein
VKRALSLALALALAACSSGPPAAVDAAAATVIEDAGTDAEPDAAIDDAGVVDAGDAGVVDAGPPLPSFADEPFPEKSTSFPKADEWASATPVVIDRARPASLFAAHAADKSPCTARRIREWVRIHCTTMTGGALLLGGNRDGLSIRFDKAAGGTEVIIPVRKGDRREIEMLDSETLSFKMFTAERAKFGFVISEQWPAGDERPTIVAEQPVAP